MITEFMDALGNDYDLAEDDDMCLDLPEDESKRFTLILMNILMSEFSGIEASVGLLNMQDNPPRNLLINLMSADKNYHSLVMTCNLPARFAYPCGWVNSTAFWAATCIRS